MENVYSETQKLIEAMNMFSLDSKQSERVIRIMQKRMTKLQRKNLFSQKYGKRK